MASLAAKKKRMTAKRLLKTSNYLLADVEKIPSDDKQEKGGGLARKKKRCGDGERGRKEES